MPARVPSYDNSVSNYDVAVHGSDIASWQQIYTYGASVSSSFVSKNKSSLPTSAGTSKSVQISSYGEIRYNSAFLIRGTFVRLNTIYYCPSLGWKPLSYQPNAWTILQDLGVNLIRVSGGSEGDVCHFNIDKYPSEWAQNLEDFLATANAHGIKVVFNSLGNQWGTLFGIVCPDIHQDVIGTPIDKAKSMIDKLAGENALNHNFLIDERIPFWFVADEPDFNNPETRDWCIQILDYMRSKGARVAVSSPWNSSIPNEYPWLQRQDLHLFEPVLRGHVDYFSINIFSGHTMAIRAQQSGTSVYQVVYDYFKDVLTRYFIDRRGSMPIENLILGSFGIQHDYEWYRGEKIKVSDQTVREYYQAVYQCARDLGIRNIINFECFASLHTDGTYIEDKFWSIDVDGKYIDSKTSAIQAYYKHG
jgi:hypothetical protein